MTELLSFSGYLSGHVFYFLFYKCESEAFVLLQDVQNDVDNNVVEIEIGALSNQKSCIRDKLTGSVLVEHEVRVFGLYFVCHLCSVLHHCQQCFGYGKFTAFSGLQYFLGDVSTRHLFCLRNYHLPVKEFCW